MLDVAIIGAGPVGSQAAGKLAGIGCQVAVLEKREEIGLKPCCTGIISQECINRFEIPEEVIFRKANSATIFAPSGDSIRVYRSEPQAGILNRPAFDRWLAERAQKQGAGYHLNCQVEKVFVAADRVKIEAREKGQPRLFESRAVILAAGFGSPLVKKLGFGVSGYCVGGAQVEIETREVDEVEVFFDQQLAPGFFAWLVPTAPDRCLAGLLTRHSPGTKLRNWLARLEAQGKVPPAQDLQIRHGGIPLKPLDRTYQNRLLVAGDAAGQVKPTTGGGIYFGMLCADVAANTLGDALRCDDLSSRNLARYEKEWQKLIGQELRIEYFARRAYERLNNKRIDSLFMRLKSSGRVESLLQGKDLSFDWHGKLMLKALQQVAFSKAGKFFTLGKS